MKAKLVNCILVFQTKQELEEGQQIVFDERIDFSTATILHHQEDKTIAAATLVDFGVFGKKGVSFDIAPTLEELQESQKIERTFDKISSRPINDLEFQLMHDYLSIESNGEKGTEIEVTKSNFSVFDISENIKKVVLTELYLCDKDTPYANTETIITQYSINEGVVIFEQDFSTIQDSGDIDISEIKDIL
jgi:hypothetical protein